MPDRGVNPYQPVVVESATFDDNEPLELSFRVTHSLLRHAEAQYLLHWHPIRLLIGSLAMIAASCFGIWWAAQLNPILFMIALLAMMLASSLVYLALVHRAKLQIRKSQSDHGLVHGGVCTVRLDDTTLRLNSPSGDFDWPRESMRVYRSGKGMLLCPKPLHFVFVPKQNDASREAFDLLRRRAEAS